MNTGEPGTRVENGWKAKPRWQPSSEGGHEAPVGGVRFSRQKGGHRRPGGTWVRGGTVPRAAECRAATVSIEARAGCVLGRGRSRQKHQGRPRLETQNLVPRRPQVAVCGLHQGHGVTSSDVRVATQEGLTGGCGGQGHSARAGAAPGSGR